MLTQIIRILLSLAFCLMLWACDKCIEYQDIAGVEIANLNGENDIDVAMAVNGSIIRCGDPRYEALVGSKTHSVKFPVNAHIQLFVEDSLWKELSFEMSKNTVLKVYRGSECLDSISPSPVRFYGNMELAKKSKRFIDSFHTDDFCWLLEKMDDSYEDDSCTEWGSGGEHDLYCGP